jgi:hypothetical protein
VGTREEVVVEASVVARLLGIRLLAIEAGVVIRPARLDGRPPIAARPARAEAIGARLAAAERVLDEGAASLEASRAVRDCRR